MELRRVITRIDELGRIVIPKEYRERLGLRPEQEFIMEIRGMSTSLSLP